MLAQENCECAQRDWQTFLLNQATSLHESPVASLAAGRKVSFTKGKFIQWNASSLDLDLFLIAAKLNDCAPQRFGTNKDQLDCIEHLARGFAIRRLVHVH